MKVMIPKKYFKNRVYNLAVVGILMVVFGIIMAFYGFPKIISGQIAKKLSLQEGTEGFEMWKEMPLPMTFKVYIFNVTNPEDVANGSKPILQEVGPYVYEEHRLKDNIIFESEDIVRYDMKKIFKFNEAATMPLREDDIVNVLNVALLGIVHKVNKTMNSMMSVLNGLIPDLFLNATTPFVQVPVKNFLFDGVYISCNSSRSMVVMACNALKARVPPSLRLSKEGEPYGFFYSMFNYINDTFDGPYTVHRGIVNPELLGNIVSYKNMTEIKEWEDECSEMKGTDATIFAPIDESNFPKRIYIYQPDVCRSMFADFISKKITLGLYAYRYETTRMLLGSKLTNPDNECFCTESWSSTTDGCLLEGVQDLSECQDVPVIASFPHFYLGDHSFRKYISGLKPDKEKHGTFVDIEPKTGAALRGAKRLQFNMEMARFEKIDIYKNVETGLFPILWVEESAEVNDKIKNILIGVNSKIKIVKAIQWIIVAVGLVMIMAACHFRRKGLSEQWSWNSNKVENVTSYGVSVVNNDVARPGAAQKDARNTCFDNNAFSSIESVAHK